MALAGPSALAMFSGCPERGMGAVPFLGSQFAPSPSPPPLLVISLWVVLVTEILRTVLGGWGWRKIPLGELRTPASHPPLLTGTFSLGGPFSPSWAQLCPMPDLLHGGVQGPGLSLA